MSNKNLSILFTGQGSQFPEMGVDLASQFSWVKERYQQSSDILGYDILKKQEDAIYLKGRRMQSTFNESSMAIPHIFLNLHGRRMSSTLKGQRMAISAIHFQWNEKVAISHVFKEVGCHLLKGVKHGHLPGMGNHAWFFANY